MDHKVIGTTMPVLEMQLAAGESIVAEGGELSWMTGPIELAHRGVAARPGPRACSARSSGPSPAAASS